MPAINLAGLKIGHAVQTNALTGCTVFLCPPNTVASVDIRGPAPGSRESALLAVDKPIDYLHAVVLTGGSAFGLATADGVMRYLAENKIGHPTRIRPIPLVAAAVVYDLFLSKGVTPDAQLGYAACRNAHATNMAQGNVGAGVGVTVGKWNGFETMMKSGFGLASLQEGDLVVGAAAVVNAVGDVVNADGSVLAGACLPDGSWCADHDPLRRFPDSAVTNAVTNTTLVVVYTNAKLSKVQAYRLAQRAHDGMAIAIRPVHTSHDGDTAFALSTGNVAANFDLVANAAVEMVAEAIRNGVRHAS
ncbi:MAG: P1 family peptidase [Chloroflexota bacterium]|jgi:L-aminopeptidase/D-esterase-like protein